MSNLICKCCESNRVVYDGYYAGSTFYRCKNCGSVGGIGAFSKPTVFHRITASPETLAEKLVYIIVCAEDTSMKGWTSAFTDVHETKEQAIAATVAKLKEVEDE